ncbi:MAG: hypothetical protein M3O29_07335 [Actinomycetota bacterium]|nr:hypothetical protein [Actinomycetota bacterium]
MSAGGATRQEIPPDTRPIALLLGGIRRGALLVFLPLLAAGQLLAWLTDAVTGWYRPWSWVKIGLAESLTGARVAFDATIVQRNVAIFGTRDVTTTGQLVVATGALTVAVLVLAFRAGRYQGRGLEERPLAAALAGSSIGLGYGVPAFISALPVTLGLQRFGIDRLEPVLWQALLLPLCVAAAAGATGGLAGARHRLEDGRWEAVVAAIRGGATGFWWGIALSFVGVLLAAALSPGPLGSYARFVNRADGAGAATVVEHALLLPNQSALVLATAMGATTSLRVGQTDIVDVTRQGVRATGPSSPFLAGLAGSADDQLARFPWWFAAFLLVPLAAAVLGGRAARGDRGSVIDQAMRGAGAGLVFAALCAVAVWAASITVPTWGSASLGSVAFGASPIATGALAVVWGVPGGIVGAALGWPARLTVGSATPR